MRDLGAGRGALTAQLVERGARVIAVELHPARARSLARRFAGRPVTVVQADAASLRRARVSISAQPGQAGRTSSADPKVRLSRAVRPGQGNWLGR